MRQDPREPLQTLAERRKWAFVKTLRKISLTKGATPEQVEAFAISAYHLSRASGTWASRFGISVEGRIEDRVMSLLLSEDIEAFLKDAGLLLPAEDRKLGARLRAWKKKHSKLLDGAASVALNAASLKLYGVPAGAPSVSFMGSAAVPPKVLALIRERGFDAAYPELKRLYGAQAGFDVAWSVARKAYFVAILGVIGHAAWNALDRPAEPEAAEPAPVFNDSYEQEQVRALIRTYHVMDPQGGWPDPEALETRAQLQDIALRTNDPDPGHVRAVFEQVLKEEQRR